MPFELMPMTDRRDEYSKSIKTRDKLWALPTYNVGEVWRWYAKMGFEGDLEVVQVLSEYQIIFKVLDYKLEYEGKTYNLPHERERYYLGERRDKNDYVTCGTPQLRERLK